MEQLDQSLRGAGQGGPPLFWLADPWEVQGVSKLAGEGLWGRMGQSPPGLGWLLCSGLNPSPRGGSEWVRSVSKSNEFFCCRIRRCPLSLLRLVQGYGGARSYGVWLARALCEPLHTCKGVWV